MKYPRKSLSLRTSIFLVLSIVTIITVFGTGHLVFSRWYRSAENTVEQISESISESLYEDVSSFLQQPLEVNAVNQRYLQEGILDLTQKRQRSLFFFGVLDALHDDFTSFRYVSADGKFFSAQRDASGEIKDGSSISSATDVRSEVWYQAAIEAKEPIFSPIDTSAVKDDLVLSAVHPIYDSSGSLQGVLANDLLLSSLTTFLKRAVHDFDGAALIVEKESGAFIANSLGIPDFSILSDGSMKRTTIKEVEGYALQEVFNMYQNSETSHLHYDGASGKFHILVQEISLAGLHWVVLTSIPSHAQLASVMDSMMLTVLLYLLALVISILIYYLLSHRMLLPVKRLLSVAESLSAGDLSKRVEVVRDDEIGNISMSMNRVADSMQILINNLEERVSVRTRELESSRNQLQLILDSTAEAIYGIDVQGNCTFCNRSALQLLGYRMPSDLLGKSMHQLIHHSRLDGTSLPLQECKILHSMQEGMGYASEDEVFWRSDGTSFAVAYHSYPQKRDNQVIGGVVTFMDITERKQREEQIAFLSSHDSLTGLFNRRYVEIVMQDLDTEKNLPFSLIFADINGLKMTNDIFGHSSGDKLIINTADILRGVCRKDDVLARIGGDEFILLLPRTEQSEVHKIVSNIRFACSQTQIKAIRSTISIGYATKQRSEETLDTVMVNAENMMYHEKSALRSTANDEMLQALISSLHSRSAKEKRHAQVVQQLSVALGKALHLSQTKLGKLERAAYLHDIGKVTLDDDLLLKEDLNADEVELMRQHSVIGYRILNLFDDTLDLAECVYSHHERWDGNGYPRGLEGDQIPLLSRIISIAEVYNRVCEKGYYVVGGKELSAIETIRELSGTRFDPRIANIFVGLIISERC